MCCFSLSLPPSLPLSLSLSSIAPPPPSLPPRQGVSVGRVLSLSPPISRQEQPIRSSHVGVQSATPDHQCQACYSEAMWAPFRLSWALCGVVCLSAVPVCRALLCPLLAIDLLEIWDVFMKGVCDDVFVSCRKNPTY